MHEQLIIRSRLHRDGYKTDRYEARLNGELLVTSRQPLLDGARAMMKRGYPPETLLSMRHEGAPHVAILPHPIGELSKWTIKERDRGGLRRERHEENPFGTSPVRARTGEDRLDDILVRDDADAILAA